MLKRVCVLATVLFLFPTFSFAEHLGYTEAGSQTMHFSNEMHGSRFEAVYPFTGNHIHVYVRTSTLNNYMRVGVYDTNLMGSPKNLLAESNSHPLIPNAWNTIPLTTPVNVHNGEEYCLFVQFQNDAGLAFNPATGHSGDDNLPYGPFPDPVFLLTFASIRQYSIYLSDEILPLTATATRTHTSTQTATPTASPTASRTPTSTITQTYSPTPTYTATRTSSPTPSTTPTFTATHSPTATITPTFTVTPSITKTSTPTATSTTSPTSTITPTFTITNTASLTATITPTATLTSTQVPSATATLMPYAIALNKVISYPSPGRGERLYFYYQTEGIETMQIDIYTVLGEHAKTITQTHTAPGFYSMAWDIRNTASGIYLYKWVRSPSGSSPTSGVNKLVIVRQSK